MTSQLRRIQMTQNTPPEYDPQTLAFIQSAKMSIAQNHGLALDRDPAEVMRENNRQIHEAAQVLKKQKGIAKQTLAPMPSKSQPVQQPTMNSQMMNGTGFQKQTMTQPTHFQPTQNQEPSSNAPKFTDDAMRQQGYDSYMEQMMRAPEHESDGVELSDLDIQRQAQVAAYNGQGNPNYGQVEQPSPPRMQGLKRQYPDLGGFDFTPSMQNALTDTWTAENETRIQEEVKKTASKPKRTRQPKAKVENVVAPEPAPELRRAAHRVQVAEPPRAAQPQLGTIVTNFGDVRGLPSEGRLYDVPIMGQAMTLMDILMMNNMDHTNSTSTITELFNRRLSGGWYDGFNSENLAWCDESYLLHWLRASTVDDVNLPYYNDKGLPFTCSHCHKTATTQEEYSRMPINFSNLNFKINGDLDAILGKFNDEGYYAFKMEDTRECHVYIRRRYHERMIDEYLEQFRQQTHTEMPFEKELLMRYAIVTEIEDCEDIVQKLDYLSNLNYTAGKKFFTEMDSSMLSTEITATIRCPFCGEEEVIPYPFRFDTYLANL